MVPMETNCLLCQSFYKKLHKSLVACYFQVQFSTDMQLISLRYYDTFRGKCFCCYIQNSVGTGTRYPNMNDDNLSDEINNCCYGNHNNRI